jgi:hypothetical protein
MEPPSASCSACRTPLRHSLVEPLRVSSRQAHGCPSCCCCCCCLRRCRQSAGHGLEQWRDAHWYPSLQDKEDHRPTASVRDNAKLLDAGFAGAGTCVVSYMLYSCCNHKRPHNASQNTLQALSLVDLAESAPQQPAPAQQKPAQLVIAPHLPSFDCCTEQVAPAASGWPFLAVSMKPGNDCGRSLVNGNAA